MGLKKNTLYVLFCFLFVNSEAQKTDSINKNSFVLLPIVFSSPEIGIAYGGISNYIFSFDKSVKTRSSNIVSYFYYTTLKQFSFQIINEIFTKQEKFFLKGQVGYVTWKEEAYQIGARIEKEKQETISYNQLAIEQKIYKKIMPSLFVGLGFNFSKNDNISSSKSPQNSFALNYDNPKKEFTLVGASFDFLFDNRDNIINAEKGLFVELTCLNALETFGSTNDVFKFRLDMRTYKPLLGNQKNILAGRVFYEQVSQGSPYLMLPTVGVAQSARGYVWGRYRGNAFINTEIELRSQIWKKIGTVVFMGLHSLTETNNSFQYINPSLGLGMSYLLNPVKKNIIRIEYAFGINNNRGLYVNINRAF